MKTLKGINLIIILIVELLVLWQIINRVNLNIAGEIETVLWNNSPTRVRSY